MYQQETKKFVIWKINHRRTTRAHIWDSGGIVNTTYMGYISLYCSRPFWGHTVHYTCNFSKYDVQKAIPSTVTTLCSATFLWIFPVTVHKNITSFLSILKLKKSEILHIISACTSMSAHLWDGPWYGPVTRLSGKSWLSAEVTTT